jgi:hypothetical protein
MSAQRQRTIGFATEGSLLALNVNFAAEWAPLFKFLKRFERSAIRQAHGPEETRRVAIERLERLEQPLDFL